ncbi:MAG: adenosylcobinamide amidohydrolase, partial [Actinomycetota bacterium]
MSTAIVGGGITTASWVLNLSVVGDYARLDPVDHLDEIAAHLGLTGSGVAMMTAVPVDRRQVVEVDGAVVTATVGVGTPTWAADPDSSVRNGPVTPGTINIIAAVPAGFEQGAMVNLVTTITEAKTQALIEGGVAGTGTATDAVCVVGDRRGPRQPFGGSRSEWGTR